MRVTDEDLDRTSEDVIDGLPVYSSQDIAKKMLEWEYGIEIERTRLVMRHCLVPRKHPSLGCRSIVWLSRPLSIARRRRSPSCLSHTAFNTTSSRPSISCW